MDTETDPPDEPYEQYVEAAPGEPEIHVWQGRCVFCRVLMRIYTDPEERPKRKMCDSCLYNVERGVFRAEREHRH